MSAGNATYTQDKRIGKLSTDLGKDALLLLNLSASERLSESYTVTLEAFSQTAQPIHSLLGTQIGVAFESGADVNVNRDFAGMLWEYSELGAYDRGFRYRLVLRPQADFMTLNKRNRIFQNQSAVDIVTSLIVGKYTANLGGSYAPLDYCVQYQESDFDFISRLMEYEGIYYYYTHEGMASELILVDNANAHTDMTPSSARVLPEADRRADAPIWSVTERRGLGPTKVTVADYDFEAPSTTLLATKSAPAMLGKPTLRGSQTQQATPGDWSSTAEVYDFPAKYSSKSIPKGDHYGATWLDSHRRRMARSFAQGSLFAAQTGKRLTLEYEDGTTTEYLIVGTAHDYDGPNYNSGEGRETFSCSLELMPATDQYRPALATPRPRILGPQTAIVVGPAGEEIYTDPYGRVKVQFFWDRQGKKDENSSCFIRVTQSVAGQSWGSFMLPRIGQEVVVEFLDGDPDRPLVTGAVYNANNTAPVMLPDNKTQFGLRTRITKGGGGHSHWWFEDKKGEEVVWFRAERDYKAHIVNQDEERQYDHGHRTTLFKQGNDTLTLDRGNLTTTISTGDETRTITTGKRTTSIKKDETLEIKEGDRATTIDKGNDALRVKMGNIDIKADLGKISMEAMQSIELKVGGSSITIDQIGVKIKGTVMVDIKGVMVQSSADAMQTIKGGLVMIN